MPRSIDRYLVPEIGGIVETLMMFNVCCQVDAKQKYLGELRRRKDITFTVVQQDHNDVSFFLITRKMK